MPRQLGGQPVARLAGVGGWGGPGGEGGGGGHGRHGSGGKAIHEAQSLGQAAKWRRAAAERPGSTGKAYRQHFGEQ